MKDQYRLYHYPICPFSRKIRIILHEKEIDYVEVIENFWEKRDKFCIINPTGMVPFLAIKRFDIDKPLLIFGVNSIIYYLENKFPKKSTIFGSLDSAVEIMKMSEWFDLKFYSDVSKYILNERVYLWYKLQKQPDMQLLKLARLNLDSNLKFITNILSKKDWIGGTEFSLADISCASHLSSLDYLGEINWNNYSILKDWYSIIKSKPSFRNLLSDSLSGFKASKWYRELDF